MARASTTVLHHVSGALSIPVATRSYRFSFNAGGPWFGLPVGPGPVEDDEGGYSRSVGGLAGF